MATELSSTKVAGGTLRRVKHASAATATDMVFAIFTPAATVEPEGGWPVIYWLSGLTCDDTQNSLGARTLNGSQDIRCFLQRPCHLTDFG